MSDELSESVPDVWLVEFTNEQMATFWSVTESYEEGCLGDYDEDDESEGRTDDYVEERAELRSLQSAVSNARPIWNEQSPTKKVSNNNA